VLGRNETIVRLQEAKRVLMNDIVPGLPEPPTGARFMHVFLPFNPPGDRMDLDFARGSALQTYHGFREQGWEMVTPLAEVVLFDHSVVYFWFHAAPPRSH
jgi:hypothetical protein